MEEAAKDKGKKRRMGEATGLGKGRRLPHIKSATFRRLRNIRGQVDEFLPLLFTANNFVRRNRCISYTLPSNKEAFDGGFSTVEGQHVRPQIGHAAYPIRAAQKSRKSVRFFVLDFTTMCRAFLRRY